MVDSQLGILEPAVPTKLIDAEQLIVGAFTVQRERIQVTGLAATDVAVVTAANGLEVDITRVLPGVGALNLGKAEDTLHTDGDVGVMGLGVRNDAVTALAGDGDYHPMMFNVNGRLLVQTEGGGGGTAATDDAPYTLAVDSGTPAMGFFGDAAPDSVDDGDAGVLRMSANRNLYATLRDAAGNERGVNVTAGNALVVDGSAVTQPISAAALPLPAGASTSALQLPDGHDVTVDNVLANPVQVQIGDGVDTALVTPNGELLVRPEGSEIDPGNSSIVPLGISAVFTGTGVDILQFGSVSIQIFADEASVANGMSIEWSIDGVDWDIQDQHSILANVAEQFVIVRAAQFFRIVYTNGGTAQTLFRLETILNPFAVSGEIKELDVVLDAEDLALTTRSVIAGETPGGAYMNVQVSTGGNFKIDVEELGGVAISLNAGVEDAGTQRMTIATDNVVSIDDNAGSLTVDAPLATPVNVQVGDGTDALGIYVEDAPAVADPIGTAEILVRQDTPAGLTTTDGDNVARRGTDFGAAYAQIVTSAGAFVDTFGGGTQFAVDDPLGATPTGTLAITRRDSVLGALTPVDDDAEVLRVDGFGSLWNALSADDGARIPADSTDGLKVDLGVDNDVTIASESAGLALAVNQTSVIGVDGGAGPANVLSIGGTEAGGNIQEARVDADGHFQVDVLSSALPTGAATLANQQTDALTDAELRATAVPISAASLPLPTGASTLAAQLPDGHDVTVDNAAGATSVFAQGAAAHDAAVAGNPMLVGAYAETPDDSAPGNQVTADADVVRLSADRDGALYTHPHPPRIWHVATAYAGAETDTTVKAAPGAGLSLYITDIYVAAEGAVDITLEEGTTTLKFRYFASGEGDGVVMNLTVPIKIAANTLISITTSAAVNVMLVLNGFTAP